MKTVKFGKFKKALRGKGFLIALVLSITAVGASTYLAYNQAISKIGFLDDDSETEILGFGDFTKNNDKPVDKEQEGVPVERDADVKTDLPVLPSSVDSDGLEETISADVQGDESAEEANNFIEPKAPKIMPVEGEVTQEFSNGELVKSKTLGVWKTHDGVDIAAEQGTPVLSMTNGTVSEVFSDALWGICVTVDHGDGLIGCYFGLDKNVPVVVGQTVSAGDVIGSVGNTAEIEIAEPPHLHFAIKKNSQWIDPVAFIAE